MHKPGFVAKLQSKEPVKLVLQIYHEVSEDDLSGGAAELAYRFTLALFPFFIFLAALGGFVASAFHIQNPTDQIMNQLGDSLPKDTASVLRTQLGSVIESHNAGLLSIGIVGALWSASSGIGALMKTMDRIFEVDETRSMVQRYAIALGLTVLGAGLMVVAFALFFTGQVYGPQIAGNIGLQGEAATAFTLARWPIAVAMILIAVAFLYWQAPNTDVALRWVTPGALFFAVVWLVATYLFGLYVSHFGSYNATYGALGGVVVLLVWLYLTGFVILLGAEIDSVLEQRYAEESKSPAAERRASNAQEQTPSLARQPEVRVETRPAAGSMTLGLLALVWGMALVRSVKRR
ncbi:MAG TPA: YihY/virulence factor BrkB family protein [Dehalococcoidia bacterium]|nr:YihY/virulence factor BrkB family protein [Dehalococcoidia bacterium]